MDIFYNKPIINDSNVTLFFGEDYNRPNAVSLLNSMVDLSLFKKVSNVKIVVIPFLKQNDHLSGSTAIFNGDRVVILKESFIYENGNCPLGHLNINSLLCHEIKHHEQMLVGDLLHVNGVVYWKGEPYELDNGYTKNYLNQPWEIEAYREELKYVSKHIRISELDFWGLLVKQFLAGKGD